MSELGKRIWVSVVFIPLLLWVLYYGALPLVILFLVVSGLGFFEYTKMMANIGIKIGMQWVVFNSLIFLALVFTRSFDMPLMWLVFISVLFSSMLLYSRQKSIQPMLATLFGLIYVGIMPAMIVRIGLDYQVQKILLALILMIWIVDSIAYLIGMKFGKHRNITEISPRKSIEGFVAGAIAPLFIVILSYIIGIKPLSMQNMLLIAVAAGIVGQLGDLCESMLKRFCGVKDSSDFIPGHGGILDRMDSLLLSGSFLYVALIIIENVR